MGLNLGLRFSSLPNATLLCILRPLSGFSPSFVETCALAEQLLRCARFRTTFNGRSVALIHRFPVCLAPARCPTAAVTAGAGGLCLMVFFSRATHREFSPALVLLRREHSPSLDHRPRRSFHRLVL